MMDERRRANRRIGWMVVVGMIVMAAIAAVYALATIDFRRHADTMRPDMPSFGRSITVSLAIFLFATVSVAALAKWFNRRRQ